MGTFSCDRRTASAIAFSSPKLGRTIRMPLISSRCLRKRSPHCTASCQVWSAPICVLSAGSITGSTSNSGSSFARSWRASPTSAFGKKSRFPIRTANLVLDIRYLLFRNSSLEDSKLVRVLTCDQFTRNQLALRLSGRTRLQKVVRLVNCHAGDLYRRLQDGRGNGSLPDRLQSVGTTIESD